MNDPQLQFDRRPLLAKSPPKPAAGETPQPSTWPSAVFLDGHLHDVASVAEAFCLINGARALEALDLDPALWLDRLSKTLHLSALAHDLGKANGRFQAMVYGVDKDGFGRQPIRHEALSAWAMLHPHLLRPKLFPEDTLHAQPERTCALLAVLGHHVKFCVRGPSLMPGVSDPNATGPIRLLFHHPHFQRALALSGLTWAPATPLTRTADEILDGDADGPGLYDLTEELDGFLLDVVGYDGRDPHSALDSEWGRFLALVKVAIVGCDVAGSAAPRSNLNPGDWASTALKTVLTPENLNSIINSGLKGKIPRPFQQQLGQSATRVTVAVAGCGTGKTLGAYKWAERHAKDKKLFVCYPTTGTATEGFADYIMDSRLPSALVHSRASVDLDRLHHYPDDDLDDDLAARIRGLEMITCAITTCTVDSVLGLVQNHRRGLSSSIAVLGGAFVFDEVHAYDASLWRALLAFLRLFRGARILLMTATLPAERREALDELLRDDISYIQGPAELETMPRYRLHTHSAGTDLSSLAVEAAAQGKRVLMVSNTVGRTLKLHERLTRALAAISEVDRPALMIYHSRFRYVDRANRHREVVDAFKGSSAPSPAAPANTKPVGAQMTLFGALEQMPLFNTSSAKPTLATTPRGVIALTTQVAEMSLDLDADLLITEQAPVPSLIQRLGRLNRHATPETCSPRNAHVVLLDDMNILPYGAAELDEALAWLADLGPDPLSQRTLAERFDAMAAARKVQFPEGEIALIATPVQAHRGALRESGVTGNFLWHVDADAAQMSTEHAIKSAIPMTLPRWWRYRTWRKIGMCYVAPEGLLHYDPLTGGRWASERD